MRLFIFRYTIHIASILVILIPNLSCSEHDEMPKYTVAEIPWEPGLGNHRAVLSVNEPAEAVKLDLLWRRSDRDPANKRFLIINGSTNDTIPNIKRLEINNERCELLFGPVTESGKYYFYYLPYKPDTTYGSYRYDYLKPEYPPDKKWLKTINTLDSTQISNIDMAECRELQARTAFDSFYPMEVITTQDEKEHFLNNNPADYLVFPEDREFPIRMTRDIPLKWILESIDNIFEGIAQRNEYYAFQMGLYASKKEIKNIKLEFSDLVNKNGRIPASGITCFNISGIDSDGNPFTKNINVPQGQVQALWLGIDIPERIDAGLFEGTVKIIPDNAASTEIKIKLRVTDKVLDDRGDSEPWRHSRLRWLNSSLGIDDEPVEPYKKIEYNRNGIVNLTGKEIKLGKNLLPESINVYNNEILNRPIAFRIISGKSQEKTFDSDTINTIQKSGKISIEGNSRSADFSISTNCIIEFDGYINYKVSIKAKRDVSNAEFLLDIPFRNKIAEYMMGMGLSGTTVPGYHKWKWEGPHDSFWVGNTKGGLHCELRGSSYHGPLLNLYRPEYPDSWYNNGRGWMNLKKQNGEVLATISSGRRSMKKNDEIKYEFSLILTPVKEVNSYGQFTNRYYHNGGLPAPGPEDLRSGIKVINVHHANKYIPYINYPFLNTDSLRSFIDYWHAKGMKVKIYYTIRELTNHLPELWALRSLNYEILQNGPGGGFPWLREHLHINYRRQWYQPYEDGGADAALLTSPGDTRWVNYYIEGLDWLVKNMDIDGIYLDDVSFDRRTLKRMRKVLIRSKPDAMIDLHSNTGFSKGPAIQYTEFFPYVDKLWFGESFQYNDMPPDNWLVEVSGLPFGLMGDMLHGGGNRWLGMLYGMTVRLPWNSENVISDPKPVWKFWDDYNIAESKMIGFWEEDCPVETDDPDVKVTVYEQTGRLILAIGNFSEVDRKVILRYNRPDSSLDLEGKQLIAPYIENFQDSAVYKPYEKIGIEAKKGLLLILEK